MARKRKTPLVAICGRPNVGKSTLFNRIIGKQRAIVHNIEGITRDRFYGEAEWNGRQFRVVDTGGIVEKPKDSIIEKMQEQVREALKEADVIVFVVDGQQEITRVDKIMCEELFKLGKKVVLAVNKLDNPNMEVNRHEFHSLGIAEPMAISSGHGLGTSDLLDLIVKELPEASTAQTDDADEESEEPGVTKVAVIGKPNVGKSSFINAILNENRTIVDPTPGTTRDAIDIDFVWNDKHYLLIDTAGLRKKAGIKQHVEHFSVSRSLRAVRRANVCLLMMDGTDDLSEQDKRIMNYVVENGVGVILVWTKWDLVEDKKGRLKELFDQMDLKAPFLKWAPIITISNVSRQRLFKTFEFIDKVAEETRKRISTSDLNKFMDDVRAKHKPPTTKGKSAKILYATQTDVKPTTFVLFVNQKRLFHFSYIRFIENRLREQYGLKGVPIKIELREGKPKK